MSSIKPPDARVRLTPDERREQLLRVTSEIIAKDGVDNVRIPYVATAAGVTRPVVYKFFENRQALVKAVLEDFREDFYNRLPTNLDSPDTDVERTTRKFIDAACDTIEARGAGGWQLMRGAGPDPEIEAISRDIRHKLVEPWLPGLQRITGSSDLEALALADLFLAGAAEILQRWIDGDFSRKTVATLLERIILAVLSEFSN